MNNEKIAIHCPTKELWDKVERKAGSYRYATLWHEHGKESCIDIKDNTAYSLGGYKIMGYTIIPAEEWLAELKVGDSVEVVGFSSAWNGDKGKIMAKVGTLRPYNVNFKNGDSWWGKEHLKLMESEDSMKEDTFSIGDEVKIIKGNYLGTRGVIKEINRAGKGYGFTSNNGHTYWAFSKDLELITPAYTVPLREGDKVRVGAGVLSEGLQVDCSNKTGTVEELFVASGKYGVMIEGSYRCLLVSQLQLIPTDKDIVVGSVWESKEESSKHWGGQEVLAITENHVDYIYLKDEEQCNQTKRWFLDNKKLIHRGDEVVESKDSTQVWVDESGEIDPKAVTKLALEILTEPYLNEPKQTNKKEKKMKREEMEIKKNMPIFDEECGNTGKVVGIFKASDQASYLDDEDGKVRTVSMSQLHYKAKLVLPKPKPVVKKKVVKKKTKKKTKKK